ncbi:neutral amino acid permease [Pseudohyphozyma bogoriensis]|nr:neutral amino acid permease [Pseudohyphozyma bogoriensis]
MSAFAEKASPKPDSASQLDEEQAQKRVETASMFSDIPERKLTWKQAAALLLTEYVVLAILAFPWSFSVLGMAGGTIATLTIGAATLFTSHVLWRYCMRHPQIRNAGATAIQTIRGGKQCTLVWGVITGIIMFLASLLRDLKHMSALGLCASSTMFICTLVVLAGHGMQGTPNGWEEGVEITWTVWAPKGTTFVQGVNAVLNITYTWVGQALIPSFVGDMANPEDFPKALYVSMAAEFCLFTITGAVVYYYAGTQYSTAPAYGSLIAKYGKVAAGFTLPTILIVGVLYSLITSRAIFFQIFPVGSVHRTKHTVQGWSIWFAIVFAGWVISFVIGEAVPFFNDLLSLICSLFDSWFGFILWAAAWYELNRGKRLASPYLIFENVLSFLMFVTGAFFLVAGTYASVESIRHSYHTGAIKAPFQCTNTGFTFSR